MRHNFEKCYGGILFIFLIVIMFLVIYGLIAAAIGALSMLMSEPTAESYVKRTCMFVLSIATFTFTFI